MSACGPSQSACSGSGCTSIITPSAPAATEASAGFVDAPYTLEVLEGVNHWIPELAAERTGELVTAHVRTHG